MMNCLLFISMISFQLSGAVILLINNDMFRFDEKSLLKSYYSKEFVINRKEESGDYIIPAKVLQESFSIKKRNFWSVLLILFGYLISAFSPYSSLKSIINFALVVVMTTVIIALVYKLTNKFSKKHFPKDLVKTEKEIDDLGIDGNFTSFDTNAEIEAIFKT